MDFPNYIGGSVHVEGDYSIVYSTPSHAEYIAKYMRIEDVRECVIHGFTPWRALNLPLTYHQCENYTLLYKDTPLMMGGIVENYDVVDIRMGTIWMLGTYDIRKHIKPFMKISKPMIEYLMLAYDAVENVVPLDHMRTISYLARLGFVFSDEPIIVNGFPCVRFVRCANGIEVSFE